MPAIVLVMRKKEGCNKMSKKTHFVTAPYDLILIMEGEADMTACMNGHYDCSWRKSHGICKIHLNLMAVQKEINQKLQSKSLWDIIGKTT